MLTTFQASILAIAEGRSVDECAAILGARATSVSAARNRLNRIGLIRKWKRYLDPIHVTAAGRRALADHAAPTPPTVNSGGQPEMTRDELQALINRANVATGPDREIDAAIWSLLSNDACTNLLPYTRRGKWADTLIPPTFTASVDALTAMIEQDLPGWCWRIGTCCVSDDAWLAPDFNSPEHGERLKASFPHNIFNSVFDAGVDIDRRPPGNLPLAICEAYVLVKLSILEWQQEGVVRYASA